MPGSSRRKATEELDSAKKHRKVCFSQITNLVADSEENGNNWSKIQISIHLSLLESYFKRFEKYQEEIERIDDGEVDQRINFMNIYIQAKERLLTLQNELTPATSSTSSNFCSPRCGGFRTRSIIPSVPPPKFDGTYSKWTEFINTFEVYINSDTSLTAVEKFQLLRSCLSGSAAVVINSLECDANNYSKALSMLKNRFENKRLIFNAHLSRLTNVAPIHRSPNAFQLRHLVDSCNGEMRALQSLGNKEQIADAILINEICTKLDSATRSKWEETQGSSEIPSWEKFIDFLTKRCQTLEYIGSCNSNYDQHYNKREPHRKIISNITAQYKGQFCPLCKSVHPLFRCSTFLKLSPKDRFNKAKILKVCINCLRSHHIVKDCPSSNCSICSKRHHTTLHFGGNSVPSTVTQDSNKDSNENQNNKMSTNLSALRSTEDVILATALIEIVSASGSRMICRALLDSGSQSNFVTENVRQLLALPKRSSNCTVLGVNCSKNNVQFKTNFTVNSLNSSFTESLEALVLSQITSAQPSTTINISSWDIPRNINLADPGFNKPSKIDILLGAELFYKFLCVGQISLGKALPSLQKTVFGWIVSGAIKSQNIFTLPIRAHLCSQIEDSYDDEALQNLLKRFWEVEEIETHRMPMNEKERQCEEIFTKTTTRKSDGRFVVRLPFENNPSALGDSLNVTTSRYNCLKKKLSKNLPLRNEYEKFMSEYQNLGHMEPINCTLNSSHYFIPHHGVEQMSEGRRKLRVVFDASCKTSSGTSLNNLLLKGPKIINDIFSVLCRFSFHKYVLTVDIVKMYRQILIHPDDTIYQLILWQGKNVENTQIFKLNTVTYGTASAPFLAMRCLKQLAIEHKEYRLAANALFNDLYVDDILTGANTIEELINLKDELINVMSKAQMQLHKWCSNTNIFLNSDANLTNRKLIQDSEEEKTKALGLNWLPSSDKFFFEFNGTSNHKGFTKRSVLSSIASLYDPLGLVAPIIVTSKIFMQTLWKRKLHWDESLPCDLHTNWALFLDQLKNLSEIKFDRLSILPNANYIEFHGFSDASEQAYGACVFVKSTDPDLNVHISLLCAKSRVAPVKTLSIPRLELCGALLLSELLDKVSSSVNFGATKIYCWTDSSIVLSWLRSHPSSWNTFVSHRVSKIQTLSQKHYWNWNHVKSENNPADILSRGAFPNQLKQSNLWFHGPSFLKQTENHWPVAPSPVEVDLERKQKTILLYSHTIPDVVATSKYVNNFRTLRRIFAYVQIFINNIKAKLGKNEKYILLNRDSLELSKDDIMLGEMSIIRIVQYSAYEFEIDSIRNNKALMKKNKILRLSPFLDDNHVLRVGGRLQKSCLDFDAKHQILLPRTHIFTKNLIFHLHRTNMHAGTETLLSIIRQKYWVPSSRQLIKSVIHSCLICFRSKPIISQQMMGNLPTRRVQSNFPFLHVGVDYCGPFLLKQFTRGKVRLKAYVAVFICFSTKAVHLELVCNLSTEAFIAALHRFVSRRGKPASITSDNATNFVGAKRQLRELKILFLSEAHNSSVNKFCNDEGIEWHFIPPRSPHFGGLWEASIKKAKYHLTRVLQNNVLNHEEYTTVLCRIEAVINSRPLTPISSDPQDLEALTPAHFLIGRQLSAIAEPDETQSKLTHLSRWQLLSRIQQHFWKRWKNEYLSTLQERNKWMIPKPNITENSMVLLIDENKPTTVWPLGRVEKIYKGDDGKIRVIDVRTANGIFKRAIQKVCVLPIEEAQKFEVPSRPGGC